MPMLLLVVLVLPLLLMTRIAVHADASAGGGAGGGRVMLVLIIQTYRQTLDDHNNCCQSVHAAHGVGAHVARADTQHDACWVGVAHTVRGAE